ncbi:MAG TPA: nuclear transport factor 2 family protein [Ferruginibacter sp.]|nr:nuclear transport factor 2 family protein [Ferruginibacter sp.]
MKKILLIASLLFVSVSIQAQKSAEQKAIEQACLDYLDGFYEGDTMKIIRSIKPSLFKFGYWKNKKTDEYESDGNMTFTEAVAYARKVNEKKSFAKAGSPKKVEVLDIVNHIASAKVTAWWGVDYILLSKNGDRWLIEQVLWEGPLEKNHLPN